MMLLTREVTEKGRLLKTQMLVATAQIEPGTEPIWQKKVFSEMSVLILI